MLELKKKYVYDGEELFDTAQVAEMLDLSQAAIRQYTLNYPDKDIGRLCRVKGQKKMRRLYSKEDIEFMKERKGQVGKRFNQGGSNDSK